VRVLRLIRIFRVFKLTAYMSEYHALGYALKASVRKILVFLSVVLMICAGDGHADVCYRRAGEWFSQYSHWRYWRLHHDHVGFGDITPKTDLGRMLASVMMLLGWGTLAVPTGIVTVEMAAQRNASR
jgi:voltage-gated potassium channel